MLFVLPRLPFLRRLSRRAKKLLLLAVTVTFLGLLSVYSPTSGISWCDRLAFCSCPASNVRWLQDDPECATELQEATDALALGAELTTETNVAVGGWWAGNVYSGLLEKLGDISKDETSKCHVVNYRTLNNAWCILREEKVQLKCLQFVREERAGRHSWTGIVKKGTFPAPDGLEPRSFGAKMCGDLTSYHHDVWTTLDAVKQPVTPEIPRHYAYVDVIAFPEDYLNKYCDDSIARYRETPTAHSGKTYPDIFAAVLERKAEILAHRSGSAPSRRP